MTRREINFLGLSIFILVMICISGCYRSGVKENAINTDFTEYDADARHVDDFLLGAGDAIDIAVYRKKTSESIIGIGDSVSVVVYRTKASEFDIGMGDTVTIEVFRNTDFNRSVKIDHSGTITVPIIGDVMVAGKNKAELRDEIKQKLSKYIVDPQVAVQVSSDANLILENLSKTFKITAQKKGEILFPLIGEVTAAGKDVLEFRKELQEKLSRYIADPQVEVNVSAMENVKIDDLSLGVVIDRSGNITLPLLGDIQAAGKGENELKKEIHEKLSEYLVDFQLSLRVSGVQSQKVHVLGEVNSPGTFVISQKILAWEAIPKAGGFTRDANSKKVLLLRSEKGAGTMAVLNIDELFSTGKRDQNIYLRNGDIVYIPPKSIANFERFMVRFGNIIEPIVSLERAFVLWPNVKDVFKGSSDTTDSVIIAP
jgi:protein involved in polysaccharide export with SLBB domain